MLIKVQQASSEVSSKRCEIVPKDKEPGSLLLLSIAYSTNLVAACEVVACVECHLQPNASMPSHSQSALGPKT